MDLQARIENENRLTAAFHRCPETFFHVGPDGKRHLKDENKKVFWRHEQVTKGDVCFHDIVLSNDPSPITDLQAVELTRHILFLGYKCPDFPTKKFQMAIVFVDFDVIGKWRIFQPTDGNAFVQINLGRPSQSLAYSVADFRHKVCAFCMRYAKGRMFKCNRCFRGGRNVYFCNADCFEAARPNHWKHCIGNPQSERFLALQEKGPAAFVTDVGELCIFCGKTPEKAMRCIDCFKATGEERLYCGRECQVKDWKKHKPFCGRGKPQGAAAVRMAALAAMAAMEDLVVSDYEDS